MVVVSIAIFTEVEFFFAMFLPDNSTTIAKGGSDLKSGRKETKIRQIP